MKKEDLYSRGFYESIPMHAGRMVYENDNHYAICREYNNGLKVLNSWKKQESNNRVKQLLIPFPELVNEWYKNE